MKVKYIKEHYLRALITGIEDDFVIRSVFDKINLDYNSDYTCLNNLYYYLLDFIQRTNISIQTVIDLFIASITSTYDLT